MTVKAKAKGKGENPELQGRKNRFEIRDKKKSITEIFRDPQGSFASRSPAGRR
jgi:hypothetical protein